MVRFTAFLVFVLFPIPFVQCKAIANNNISAGLIDNQKAPLYVMLDMSDLNKNVKTYIDKVMAESFVDTFKQTIKEVMAEEMGKLCNSTDTAKIENNHADNDTEWIPVFVACPGNKRSVYKSWVTPSPIDDPLTVSVDSCSRDHQRGSIIDHWNWKGDFIDRVKVELYKGRHVDAMFLFEGKGSTSTSWFSKGRLLQSTYNDLSRTATTNYFSIKGHHNADRNFFINHKYINCDNDQGWMLVVDARYMHPSPGCKWEQLYGYEYPYFLYAVSNKVGTLGKEGDFGLADLLVVSVKKLVG